MRLVRKGMPPSAREYRAQCLGCGSVVEFREAEASTNVRGFEVVYCVDCPVCDGDIEISRQDFIGSPTMRNHVLGDLWKESK